MMQCRSCMRRRSTDAVERAGSTDSEAICQALRETDGFPGVIGPYTYQENQDMLSNCSIMQYDADKNENFIANITVE